MVQKRDSRQRRRVSSDVKDKSLQVDKKSRIILFTALALLIFYPPFIRGLFFKQDVFIYHILSSLVFILFWWFKVKSHNFRFLQTSLDWAILAYACAYLLSLTGAVHFGEAVYGFLRALNLFLIYWMVSDWVKEFRDYKLILQVIWASALGVASIGILAATGFIKFSGAFVSAQIASTLQYSNATAAFMAVSILLGNILWATVNSFVGRLVYGLGSFLMILVLIGTMSKGAWLILLIGTLLLMLGLPGIYRARSLYQLILAVAAALLTSVFFIPIIRGEETAGALPFILIGLLVVTGGEIIREGTLYLTRHVNHKIKAVSIAMLVTVTAIILLVSMPRMIPQDILTEIQGLTETGSSSFVTRIDFCRWAIDIVKDHPLVGAGAGGWNALYHQYQGYLAYTTEVHNHFLQVWVEAGTIGFIVFISIWICFLRQVYILYRSYKSKLKDGNEPLYDLGANWAFIWGTTSAALAFGIHALIDFDLSLMSLAILLWVLLALVNAATMIKEPPTSLPVFRHATNVGIAVIIVAVLFFSGSSYALAFNHFDHAGDLMEQFKKENDARKQNQLLMQAHKSYAQAVALDSHNASYNADLAQICALVFTQLREISPQTANDYFYRAREQIENAIKNAPYDITVRSSLLNTYTRLGDIEGSIAQCEAILEATPYDANAYDVLIKVLWSGCDAYIDRDQKDQAHTLATKIIQTEQRLIKQQKKIDPAKMTYWNGPSLQLNSESHFCLAQANYVLGKFSVAQKILEPMASEPQCAAWYAATLHQLGKTSEEYQFVNWLRNDYPDQYQQYQKLLDL